jgi:hypothetical protein
MFSSLRRTARVGLAIGAVAAAAAGLNVASNLSGAASAASASDICVTVPAVWVHNQQVYSGGLVCVPFPFASQPT